MRKEKPTAIDILLDKDNLDNLVMEVEAGKFIEFEQAYVSYRENFIHAFLTPLFPLEDVPKGVPLLFTLNKKTGEFTVERDDDIIDELLEEFRAELESQDEDDEDSDEDEDEEDEDEDYEYDEVFEDNDEDSEDAGNQFIIDAQREDARAQNELGMCYYNGGEITQNYDEAFVWHMKAVEQGDAEAKFYLEKCFDKNIFEIADNVLVKYTGKEVDVIIPDNVTSIGDKAFFFCSFLKSITIPDSVTSIGDSAFDGCIFLKNITISDSVTSIGTGVFCGCSSLESISISDSVTSIGDWAFSACSSLKSIDVSKKNKVFKSIDCNLYSKDGRELIRYAPNKTSLTFTIPDSVTSIGEEAFDGCSSLESITIPDSVTSIGESAFDGCSSLESITISDGVTSIGTGVFCGCSSLESITIPDSIISIGYWAFKGCSSLKGITIPDSVTSIGEEAFKGCSSLKSITIPNNVKKIGESAFGEWDSSMTIYAKCTESVLLPALEKCNAKIVYC